MIKIIQYSLLFMCWVLITLNVKAQDPTFSQFYANPTYLNPAFAGSEICPRGVLNYRNQWPGYEASYITYSASYDQFVAPISGGLGLNVVTDRSGEGVLTTTMVQAMYAYKMQLNRKLHAALGIQGGLIQKEIDWSNLNFGDMIDDRRGAIYMTQEQLNNGANKSLDLSTGILVYNKQLHSGLAVHHLLEPDESLITGVGVLPRKYSFHGGATLPITSRGWPAILSPNIIIQRQNNFTEYNLGTYFSKGPLVAGLWYRFNDSFIVSLGFKNDNFKIGYSYDMTVTSITNKSYGSHELSVGYVFKCHLKKRKYTTVNCPTF